MQIEDFKEQTLEMDGDYEGRVIATLVHSPNNTAGQPSVLYLHGFNDYFFQAHVADRFNQNGYNLYALDLRKYGRSLLPYQHPNYCRDTKEYYEEIDRSIEIIKQQTDQEIILLGHSTGGLIAASYLNNGTYKKDIDRLILNSPFLDFNVNFFQRYFLLPMAGIVSWFFPYANQKKPFSHLYGASISANKHGEWDFNTDWKPLHGFPAYLKWIHAIRKAQTHLYNNSDISQPILILHSDKTSFAKNWDDVILKSDMVLNVEHIKKHGPRLGSNVTFAEIEGAMHDVFLSKKVVRRIAFEKILRWLD
jgi:alpha-beta hydrolase superfamily lysophospholipase